MHITQTQQWFAMTLGGLVSLLWGYSDIRKRKGKSSGTRQDTQNALQVIVGFLAFFIGGFMLLDHFF